MPAGIEGLSNVCRSRKQTGAADPLLKFGLLDCRPQSRQAIAVAIGDPCQLGCGAVSPRRQVEPKGVTTTEHQTKTGHKDRFLNDE